MPVDRELIEIVTVANMAGVEAAQKGFLGLSASTLALAAVLGAVITVGKAAIENYNSQETALNLLRQATDATHGSYSRAKDDVEEFIQTNKAYIANQYDVIATFGQIIRAGHSETESLRILNDALDLAVIKHEDVSIAGTSVIKVLAGNSKALKELGITTEEYNAIMKSKLTQEQKDAELLDLIEKRIAKGRETTDKASQSQQKLTADWQNFTSKLGPGLTEVQNKLNEALDTGVQLLDLADQALVKLGQDAKNPIWGHLQDFLLLISGKPARDGVQALLNLMGGGGSPGGAAAKPQPKAIHAAGGFEGDVSGPTLFLAGEGGADEHVSIGPTGGGAGSGVTVIIQGGIFMDDGPTMDRFMNRLAKRLRYATGV